MSAPRRRGGAVWRVRVLSGPQRGAVAETSGRRVTIGDAPGLDVRLLSPAADRRLQSVEIVADWAAPALGPTLRSLEPGAEPGRRLFRGTATLSAVGPRGERTEGPRISVQRARPGRATRRLAALALLGGLALGAAAPAWVPAMRAVDLSATWAAWTAPDPDPAPTAATTPAPDAFLDPSLALQRRLERAGLDDAVRVRRISASEIRVDGVVVAARAGRWEAIHDWFVGRFDGRVVLAVRLTPETPAGRVPARLLEVERGDPPMARLVDGRLVGLGDAVGDGWSVARIERRAIEVVRGGDRARLEAEPG